MEFYELQYNLVTLDCALADIDLKDKPNWFYVQVESSIRFAFLKHECEDILPEIVFVDKSMDNIGIITFCLSGFHGNIDDMAKLCAHKSHILETLNMTADANSTDDMKYKFELI